MKAHQLPKAAAFAANAKKATPEKEKGEKTEAALEKE